EPGMHSRVRASMPRLALSEENVRWASAELIRVARANRLDRIEGLQLPDLALLAHLQHHGAATPLLDVTVDPLVALWMVAHASASANPDNLPAPQPKSSCFAYRECSSQPCEGG